MSIQSENPADDRCQYPQGCLKSLFTFCPHCHLFLCMNHLNEHHQLIKTQTKPSINDVEPERIQIEQLMRKCNEQKSSLDRFYENQLKELTELQQLLKNFTEKKSIDQQQLTTIKEIRIPTIDSWISQIDRFLLDHDLTTKEKVEPTECLDIIVISDDETRSKDVSDGSSENNDDDEDFVTSKSLHNRCPLSAENIFGLSAEHKIPRYPCDYCEKYNCSISTDRCYHHLTTYHYLKTSTARAIIKELTSTANLNLNLRQLDLFSQCSSNELVMKYSTMYNGVCPLTKEFVYGLRLHEHFEYCQSQQAIYLHQHLRVVHHFKSACARRLIEGLIDQIPYDQSLFESDEHVTEPSATLKRQRKTHSN